MNETQIKRFRKNLQRRFPELYEFMTIDECRQCLIALVDENIVRLQGLVDDFESRADEIAASTVAKLKCDQSPETQRLLNYILRARNGLFRGFGTYERHQKRQKHEHDRTPSRDQEYRVPTLGRSRPNSGGMPEDVDLSWAYETNPQTRDASPSLTGGDEVSSREMARVDVLLDTVLSSDATGSEDFVDAGANVSESGTTPGLERSLDLPGCQETPVGAREDANSVTNEAIYERADVKRGGADFVLWASRTSPSPSASVDLAHLRPVHGRVGCATRTHPLSPRRRESFLPLCRQCTKR
jgi:hypothetical protein